MLSSIVSTSSASHVGRWTYASLVVLLGTSVGLNVLLARHVRQLEALKIGGARPVSLQIGALVPPITGRGLDGQDQTIAYTDTGHLTILYFFTPQCAWCNRNMDNLKALIKAKGEGNRFIGLSLTQVGLDDYVRSNQLTIPVLVGISSETINAYRLGGTPQTLVISPNGRVLKNWSGAWIDKQKAEIEAFFHVNLPGIQLASTSH